MKPTKNEATSIAAPAEKSVTASADGTAPTEHRASPEPEVVGADQPPADPADAQAEAPASMFPVQQVMLGGVETLAGRASMDSVLEWLGQDGRDRVEYLLGEPSTPALASNMLGTDGRCAPTVFVDMGAPKLLHGYEIIAAAKHAGIKHIPVLFVSPDDVDYVHAFIAQRLNAAEKISEDDDEFIRRIQSEDDD